MSQPVVFKVRAAAVLAPRMPRAFEAPQRSAGTQVDDPFLPPGLVRIAQVLDLTPTARSGPGGQTEHAMAADAGQVVVLELPEGVTVITHPANLHDTLQRIDPAAVDASGALVFDQALRTRGVAMRGALGDAVVGGLGFAPSANLGDKYAVFEPTHGSAPKYAGQYKVNPHAMLLTAKMMLDWRSTYIFSR